MSNFKKLILFSLLSGGLFFFLFTACCQATVSGTSTVLIPNPQVNGKIKAESEVAVMMIELSATSTPPENLDSITITVASTTNATPTQLTEGSFNWVGVAKDANNDGSFDFSDILLATSTVAGLGTTTTIDIASATTTPAQGLFFVVIKTASSTSWTDNGWPENESAMRQAFEVSIDTDGVIASSTTADINATTTQSFPADTHSQAPDSSKITAIYQNGSYIIQSTSSVGEMGILDIYSDSGGNVLLATTSVDSSGQMNVNIGSTYYSSLWLSGRDALGNSSSSLVQYNLPALPSITSIKALSDRIIFNTNKTLRGDQVMTCSNYVVNGSILSNCGQPGYPFIDFFGNQVVIRGLNLTVGSQISFSVSGIQDTNYEQFPFNYSTTTLLVESGSVPKISSISPNATTTGATVTISGSNFGTATGTLLFCGGFNPSAGPLPPVEASTTAWSDTSITAVVPPGAQSGPVQVKTADGIISDIEESSFFDVLGNLYFKIVNSTTSNPVSTSTNMRIFIGSMTSEDVYYDGDSHGTTFDPSSYLYTVPNVSSMGFSWAFDAAGNYLPAPGSEIQTGNSTSSPQVLILQGTTTYQVSGSITLGTTCTSQGKNKLVAVMALPEGVEAEMGPAGPQPSFFKTNSSCITNYTLALPDEGTYRIEAHIPPFVSGASQLLDPSSQTVTVSAGSPTASANFTFTEADRRIRGRVVGADGNPLSVIKYQELWIIAFEPKANGKSSAARANSQGYFDLYVTEGSYKIEITGPMMPFPVQKDILVDSSTEFDLTDTGLDITIKLEPPTSYIEGYVRDGSGNGIANVDIYCWCEGGPGGGHAFTDSQGYYKMYVPFCSNYHVGGFAREYGELSEKSNIAVTASQNPIVNFILESTNFVTISGQVTKNGSPQSNVDVWITQGEFGKGVGWARTDTSGNYSIKIRKGLSGLYLHAAIPGRGEIYKGILNNGNAINSDLSSQNISRSTAILEIHLKPGNTFHDVFIGAHSNLGYGFTDVRVSTSTSYDIYKIEVPFSGSTQYTIEGGIPAFGPIPATTVTVSGSTIVEIDLNSVGYYTVSGTVTVDSGTSSDAFVWAGGPNGGGGTRVNPDGTFTLRLRAGEYDIGVGKAGYSGSVTSTTVNSDISGLTLSLTRNTGATISGTVQYNSIPIANAMVWASNGQGGWAQTVSDADGSFILNVSSGDWKIEAVAEGYRLSAPLRITAPASGVTINLSAVDFDPQRKEQSIRASQGGVIQTTDTKIEIPNGALGSESTEVAIRVQNTMKAPEAQGAKIFSSKAKEISAYYSSGDNQGRSITNLNQSVDIEIKLTKSELSAEGISSIEQARKLKISYYDSTANNWVEIPTAVTLTPSNATWSTLQSITLKASTDHFSTFAPSESVEGAPPTPTGLSATAGDSQVTLSWNGSSGATLYYIYRKSGSQYPFLATTTNTSYTDTGLTNGTTYYYKVSAANDADQESAATDPVSATPVESTVTTTGGGISVENLGDVIAPSISEINVKTSDISAIVTWKTSESSISWILYGTSTEYGLEIKTSTSTTFHSLTLSGLLPETTYHYQVKSQDEAGNIGFYTDQTFTTSPAGKKLAPELIEEVEIPTVTFEKPISEMTVEEIKEKISEIMSAIAQLRQLLAQLEGERVVLGCSISKFERNLRKGMTGDDVKCLQIVLNSDPDTKLADSGPGSPGNETSYFGPLTKAAVIKFQEKYASEVLAPWGLTSGTGFVGRTTRDKLNQLLRAR
ncbi:hypothetical protein J7K03_01705 [bacterium]|nr:hypothetical protein [bacterium]